MSSSGGAPKVKRFRTKFTDEQLSTLKDFYRLDNHPRRTELEELANRLDLDYSVVKQWFDNKRHRDRPNGSQGQITPSHGSGRGSAHGSAKSHSSSGRDRSVGHGRHGHGGLKTSSGSFGKIEDDYEVYSAKRLHELSYSTEMLSSVDTLAAVACSTTSSLSSAGSPTACTSTAGTSSVGLDGSMIGHGEHVFPQRGATPSTSNAAQRHSKSDSANSERRHLAPSSQTQYFQRQDSEPMEYYEESNEVFRPMPRNTSYDKKDFIQTLLPQFLSMIERRKSAHGEVDYPGFVLETQRLFEGLRYISESRMEQGDNIERNNTFKSGYISFPARRESSKGAEAELADADKIVEISFLHESKEEGTVETTGRQVATQRLVMCYFDETQSLACEVGVKARGPSLSLDPICQCQSDVFPQHPQRIHELADNNTTYMSWGDIDKLQSLIHTSMNARELLSFLIFVISPLLHGAHWMNICMRQFFPAGTPHYYDVVEGMT